MAFGKFTNDYNVRARASSLSSTDEGLRKFMLKVYGYMSVGLGITGVVAWLFANAFVAQNPLVVSLMQPPMAYLVMFAPLGIILWMSFGINRMSARTSQNLFWVLAACYGISLASIFLVYTGATIARVFFIAASMFLTMSIWGYTTKKSLAKMGSFLMMGLIGLIIASIVNIFLGSSALQFAMSIIGVIIFAGLTAYDTQVIKEIYVENENSEDSSKKAVMGALKLYLDLLLLFQYLLMLFGNRE
jgi:FtsH-binding integral membrane protein